MIVMSSRVSSALGIAGILACAACSGHTAATGAANEKKDAAPVTITPANGTTQARPDSPVVVQATKSKLKNVVVTAAGRPVVGVFSPDRRQWRSRWTIKPGAQVSVQATAEDKHGKATTVTSGFTTQKAAHRLSVSQDPILEDNRGETYGVGLPIILDFNRPVSNKAQVERALEVRAQKPVEGAWRWIGNEEVVYRTKTYWPAHQTVTLVAHLAGVPAGKDVYGTKDFTRTYKIGRAQYTHLYLNKHRMRVYWDGKLVRKEPISAGNGSTTEYTTTSGQHLTMEKDTSVWMTSPGRSPGDAGYYHELIHYAVRISSLGEYLHQTPGDEGCLGHENCSHGCVRQPAGDAKWFYRHAQPADPVVATGTDRQVEWDNGWAFFQMPWDKWKKGSALQ